MASRRLERCLLWFDLYSQGQVAQVKGKQKKKRNKREEETERLLTKLKGS